MKDITKELIGLFKKGYCTPQIARIAKKLNIPSTTIHYNIKKLEKNEAIKAYKAVFDYKKIDEGFSSTILVSLSDDAHAKTEDIGKELARIPEVESVDLCTGDWELVLRVKAKNQDEYYNLLKNKIARKGIMKMKSLLSLKQLKTEFVHL